MNDEDFARNAFRHAMESSFAGEPTSLPSLDDIAARARRGNRTKQGVYAASAVALAGVVTAGVVAGPSVLGLGSGSPETSTAGQATGSGTATSPNASDSMPFKAELATPCPTPPQIDWAAIIGQSVPGATVTPVSKAAAPDQNICYLLPNLEPSGAMNIEVLFDLSNPTGVIQIDVNTGGSKAGQESASDAPSGAPKSPDASDLAKMRALKSAMATKDPAGAATKSPNLSNDGSSSSVKVPEATPTCAGDKPGQVICTIDVGKGGYVGMSAALTRTTPTPLFVQVIASTSAPATPGQHAPLTAAQLSTIAQAVASHF